MTSGCNYGIHQGCMSPVGRGSCRQVWLGETDMFTLAKMSLRPPEVILGACTNHDAEDV